MPQKLRIGLLLNSWQLREWEYKLIERLKNAHYASVELVVINGYKTPKRSTAQRLKEHWKQLVFLGYMKLDQKMFKVKPNAFRWKDGRDLLKEVPSLEADPIVKKFSDRLKEEDIETIRQRNIDIFVRFGFRILRGDILTIAKYGVWSYHHGDNTVNRGGPAGFWEVMENWPVTGSILQILTEDLDGGKILYRSYSQTDQRSVHRNKNNFYWKSMSFLPRKVEELYNLGETAFFERAERLNQTPGFYDNRLFTALSLDNWKMFKLMLGLYWRFARDKWHHRIYLDQWILMFSIRKGLSASFWRFKKIIPPKDRFFADPFIVRHNDKYFIFIEEFLYKTRKGHISVIEMDEKGKYQQPVTVIDKPYHLSYPFMFSHRDEYYMIPESGSNRTIELYKCVDFPLKWEFQMNLMEDVKAVDATLFYHQDKWWLFANMVENPGASSFDELFLFYADDFQTNNWTPHPMNPVVSDVSRSRPAGNIFIHGGKIIRPAQNCSERYGYGLTINEIKVLNEQEYEEVTLESIEPNWEKKLLATHTLNHSGSLTVIDGIRRRSRWF